MYICTSWRNYLHIMLKCRGSLTYRGHGCLCVVGGFWWCKKTILFTPGQGGHFFCCGKAEQLVFGEGGRGIFFVQTSVENVFFSKSPKQFLVILYPPFKWCFVLLASGKVTILVLDIIEGLN